MTRFIVFRVIYATAPAVASVLVQHDLADMAQILPRMGPRTLSPRARF
jgi:hypothetical protein